jgi:hypothetical protein
MFRMLQVMAQAGWQVIARSNGGVANNTPVSNPYPYSSGNIGFSASAELNATNAWFVVQQPPQIAGSNGDGVGAPYAGTRQLCFQRSSNAYQWRVKYSYTGSYTSPAAAGTATQVPTANTTLNDEKLVAGGGTDGSPTFSQIFGNTTEGVSRMSVFADDGSLTGSLSGTAGTSTIPNPQPYAVWMFCHTNGSATNTSMGLMIDPMVSGSFGPNEVDPFVVYVSENAFGDAVGGNTSIFGDLATGDPPKTWFRKGDSQQSFLSVGAGMPCLNSTSNGVIATTGQNALTGAEDAFPLAYLRPSTSSTYGGFKGFSSLMRGISSRRSYGTLMTQTWARDRIVAGAVLLPWDGSVFVL